MDDEELAARRCGAERIADRVLTPRSSTNDADSLHCTILEREDLGRAEVRRRVFNELLRHRDDHFVNRWVLEERADAALENGPPADLRELFQSRPAEAPAASAGCKDCGNEHRAILPFCNVSTVFATTLRIRSASALASCAVGVSSGGG